MTHGPFLARVWPARRLPGCLLRAGCLLAGLWLASQLAGCALYHEGRAFLDDPREAIECWTECPWATESVTLRHRETGVTVTCGPYPHALYASMAATYRFERQQCVTRYQQQGYLRLSRR
ncbi:MAG: hypothetical protein AB7N91_21800 [Candidatus Tectimicrobiota bacterium]